MSKYAKGVTEKKDTHQTLTAGFGIVLKIHNCVRMPILNKKQDEDITSKN